MSQSISSSFGGQLAPFNGDICIVRFCTIVAAPHVALHGRSTSHIDI